jgi:hypothetical protein
MVGKEEYKMVAILEIIREYIKFYEILINSTPKGFHEGF